MAGSDKGITMKQALYDIWAVIWGIFIMPGEAMMRSLATTPWGREWGVPAEPDSAMVIGVSLIFWCLVITFVNAADDRVRGFLQRRTPPSQRR